MPANDSLDQPRWQQILFDTLPVLVFDALLLRLAARWGSPRAALRCGVVGVSAALAQAAWVFYSFSRNGSALWAGLAVALPLTVGLLVGRGTRTFGWAVLLGSVDGFVGMFVFLIAALAAALGGD